MARQSYCRKNENGEMESYVYDTETKQTTKVGTEETKESIIRKKTLVTLEDVRALLLELIK